MIDQQTLVSRYQQLRQAGNALGLELARGLPRSVFEQGARSLGLLRQDFLVMDTHEDQGVLIDYCLYNVEQEGKTPVARAAEGMPPADGLKAQVLAAMSRAHYSIFEVTSIEHGVGVRVKDHLFGGNHLVFDLGLADSARVDAVFAARLLHVDEVTMTTGAILPLNARWLELLDIIITQLAQEMEATDLNQLDAGQRHELTTTIIHSSLSFGSSRQARFMGQHPNQDQAFSVSRTDPCPCNSGRPFGQCCGQRG